MSFILKKNTKEETVEWGKMRWLTNPANTASKHLTTLEVIIKPGEGHDFHFHPNQEEMIYVMEGQLEQWIEQNKETLNPGDSVFIPKGQIHASFQMGQKPAELFVVLGPCADNDLGYEIEEVSDQEPWASLRD